jgi:hypothetical protein
MGSPPAKALRAERCQPRGNEPARQAKGPEIGREEIPEGCCQDVERDTREGQDEAPQEDITRQVGNAVSVLPRPYRRPHTTRPMPLTTISKLRAKALVASLRRLAWSLIVFAVLAGAVLALFEGSDHRLHVLPADASPEGVLIGAALCALCVSMIGPRLRFVRR